MDQVTTGLGIRCLASNQPKSLIEWNSQYEAQSIRGDWWFKAGAAMNRAIRALVETIATQPAAARMTALRGAHA